MKKNTRKFEIVMLIVCLVLTMTPLTALAETEEILPQGEAPVASEGTTPEDGGLVSGPEENTAPIAGEEDPLELTLTATVGSDGKTATLTWNKLSDEASYEVLVNGVAAAVTPTEADDTVTATYEMPAVGNYTFKVIATIGDKNIESEEKTLTVQNNTKLASVAAYSSYNGVQLEWKSLGTGVTYAIYEGNVLKGKTGSNQFYVGVSDEKTHTYKVYTIVNGVQSTTYATSPAKAKVISIKYNCVVRSKCTLECHSSGHKHKTTFKKGFKFTAYEFSSGTYKAVVNGHNYSFKRIRLKSGSINAKGWYSSKNIYSPAEITRYVNKRGISSKTNRLIFVSTKSQHVYLFKGSAGKWVLDKYWIVSTGSPKTPTPTGLTTIKNKWKTHNGQKYWSACSTFSFHGKAKKWVLGSPKSGACIRNTNDHAKYIYDNYKCKTKVCVV